MMSRNITCLICSFVIAGWAVGCRPRAAAPPTPPPQVVTVAPVEKRELVEWDEFTGRTEAVNAVEVRPRVSGHIQEVRFQAGQMVKKGDVLFVIDPRWNQAALEQREAELEQAKVRLENAKRESDRMAQLLTSQAVSIEETDARQSRYQEAKAALLAAVAARDSAKLDLEYTQIRSPIDGRVSRALLTEGNYASGVAGMTTVLTTIVSVDPIYVHADVDENSLLKFDALQRANKLETNSEGKIPVSLQLADESDFPHVGYVESLDNRLDANTGSILLRAVFPNADGRLLPGLFARIRLPLSERYSALLIEERAIGTDQAQKFVLTLSPTNTVEYRQVQIGPLIDGKRVIRGGLKGNEKVVVNGLARVRPGMPVTPQAAVPEASASKMAKR